MRFLLLALALAAAAHAQTALVPATCALPETSPAWADSAGVACYTLAVPENRATPASRTLRLAVAVVTGPDPAEPILYLHGGPGLPTLDAACLAERPPIRFMTTGTLPDALTRTD